MVPAGGQRADLFTALGGGMIGPIVDELLVIYPEAYAIVGVGEEGVGLGELRKDPSCPPDGERVRLDRGVGRASAPIEIDRWIRPDEF